MGNKQSVKILLVGIDGSGKSTAVNHLAGRHDAPTTPSTGYATETIKLRKYLLEIYDIAGGEKLRGLWRHYFDGAKAMKARFPEAKEELKKIVHSPELVHLPILVFANKQDLSSEVISVAEISDEMELKTLLHGRQWAVLPCSAKTGEGLDDGLKWFVKTFKETAKADH